MYEPASTESPPPKDSLPDPAPPTAESPRMQYLETYAYVFRSPQWGMNLLQGAVCQIIPLVGPIVWLGYQFEVVDHLRSQAAPIPERSYPSFDFNRFVDYLKRGIWPFLVAMILAVLLTPFIMVLQFLLMIGMAAAGSSQDQGMAAVLMFLVLGLFMLAVFVMSFLVAFINLPLTLRAGLAQDFGVAFKPRWILDFIKRVWVEQLLFSLFLSVTGMCLGMMGLALCIVGVYPMAALITLAQAHMMFQLYGLYLLRGGEPIPPPKPVWSQQAPPGGYAGPPGGYAGPPKPV